MDDQFDGEDAVHLAPQGLGAYRNSLPSALLRAREALMSRLRPLLRAHDFTEQQWRVLRALSERGEIELLALADHVYLLPSSLSRIVRDLGRRGLIERRNVCTDLRRAVVALSPQGRAAIEALAPTIIEANRDIEAAAGLAHLEDLKARLDAFERALAGPTRPSSRSPPKIA